MITSIRRYLLTYLTVALLVSSFAISILTYVIAGEELEELYDENMLQVSEALLAQYSDKSQYPEYTQITNEKLHGEEEFLIQIWEGDKILYASHPSIKYPRQLTLGYSNNDFGNHEWRYYSQSRDGITVQLSQPLNERHDSILEISSKFLIPLLLQIPLLGLLIWVVVGRSLKPIDDVSDAIDKRGSKALHPLPIKRLPAEIKPLVKALNELLERLDNSLKAQRRFTADAAHELRTPLTAVQLQLDLLKRSKSTKDKKEALEQLGAGIKRSIRVVRQLLSLAHQEPEAKEQIIAPVNINSLVASAIFQFEPIAKQKHIILESHLELKTENIKGNEHSLSIMIENLLDNAIRYTPEWGKVEVSLHSKEKIVILNLLDNGPGIPVDERMRVFDRFYRIAGTEESGTGLGLSIVKQIADRHKASISLNDAIGGKGLCVSIKFSAT